MKRSEEEVGGSPCRSICVSILYTSLMPKRSNRVQSARAF